MRPGGSSINNGAKSYVPEGKSKTFIEVLKDYDFSVKRSFRTDHGPSGETEWEINSHIGNTPYDGWRGGLLILSNNKDKVFYSFRKGGSKDGYWK